ncbi:hypothetical protein B0H13DRAFT_1981833 [Mycena leptocephala]|nr:hypothetical protein B0H13DRAFT_1981833 [Mycena leptocephala]
MSSFAPGAGQGTSSHYPNAVYQGSVFSTQQPSFPVNNVPVQEAEISGSALRECSVRGCSNPLEAPSADPLTNKKMCAPCREKHRGYASTKRARRKAEKTLVSKLSAAGTSDATLVTPVNQDLLVVQYKSPVSWAIDPALYSQPSANSSSTLAGALTLQPSTKTSHTPATTSSTSTRRDDPAHRTDFSLSAADYTQNHGSTAPILPQTNFSSSGAPEPAATVGAIPQPSVGAIPQTSDSRPRFCTVKGCKAIIVESTEVYPYKMCQPCRSRYRNYGITKRAKWKTEREAFHRELEGLRAKEDLRRAANGLPPLSDSPDDLAAWELSVIDEQVPLPPGHQSAPPAVPLPARMCTVSHCHNLLPGFYRYKRCETHRIQNRWHSKLKRGREKIEKGFMLPDGTLLVTPGPIRIKKNEEPKEPKEKKTRNKKGKDAQSTDGVAGPSGENVGGNEATTDVPPTEQTSDKPIPRRSRSAYSCREEGCCNLIIPGTRWRSCETCRALSRTLRQEKKAAEKSQLNDGAFVNMTVDSSNSNAGPTIPHANIEPGSSTAIAPMDVSSRPGVPATGTPPTYPTGYTSTSTLQTLNEPPPDQSSQSETVPTSGVRLVRKYRKLPRYDKEPGATNSINAEASSSTAHKPAALSTAPTLPPQPIPGFQPSPYPYPPPPGSYPYYMPPPGYFGMSPPPGSSAPGQPPLMYVPYPYATMPALDKTGAATSGPPAMPYPYYPYALPPGYGLPQHYPRANYTYLPGAPPIPAGGHQSPYAAYKHSIPALLPPLPAADSSQGYSYYQFMNSLKNTSEVCDCPGSRLATDGNFLQGTTK